MVHIAQDNVCVQMIVLMYPHGGSGNHGCEAIVRSTVQILQAQGLLMSNNPAEDKLYGLDKVCETQAAQRQIKRSSVAYLKAQLSRLLGKKDALDILSFAPVLEASEKCDVTLSIGGDNYCYGVPEFIFLVNKELRRRKRKTVLLGCSIEPAAIKGKMLEDLQGYDLIVARESLTYKALLSAGLEQAQLLPDPAFVLGRSDLPLPEGFVQGNTVGINISPMIQAHEKTSGLAMKNYEHLIRHLIDTTDMQVALIPHVVWSNNDDRIPLRLLHDKFKETGRVALIEDHNAEEMKGFIARCRFMVAARTHASIAAYSQQVPTLVIGYSVKARGIATDLFGGEEHYVLPVQELEHPADLTEAFKWLQVHESEIRSHYCSVMPTYIGLSTEMKSLVDKI